MISFFKYEYLQNAYLAAILISITCGIIGSYIVTRRIVFISGGISHTAFGGIGLAHFLNFNVDLGAILFSILSAVGLEFTKKWFDEREDSIIGIIWALGMSIGIIFMYLTPGYQSGLESYLFGNILLVSKMELLYILIFNIILIFFHILFYQFLRIVSFDEEFSMIIHLPVKTINYFMMFFVAVAVVLLIKIVGIILVIAMLTIPTSFSNKFTYNYFKLILLSIIFGIIFNISGLLLSDIYNVPAGATIILISGIFYILNFFIFKFFKKQLKIT